MHAGKRLMFIGVVLLILGLFQTLSTASRTEPPPPPPDQMTFGSAARTDTTTSMSFVNFPTPGQTIMTTNFRTIVVQFYTSARTTVAGAEIELRAVVDGVPVNPGPMRYTGTTFSSMAYSGFLVGVAPGTHTVTMQWRVTAGSAIMGNRQFIVWVVP